MNRRDALKTIGGTTALCLFTDDLLASVVKPPVARFEEVTFNCPPKMYPIFGEGSTITQPRVANADEILGDWKPTSHPFLDFHASLLDSFNIPFPFPSGQKPAKGYLQRTNHVYILPKDGQLWVNDNNVLVKIFGLVKMSQVRFINKDGISQVTGINCLEKSICLKEDDDHERSYIPSPVLSGDSCGGDRLGNC